MVNTMRMYLRRAVSGSDLVSQGFLPKGFSYEVDEDDGCPHFQPSMPRFKPTVLAISPMTCAVKAT